MINVELSVTGRLTVSCLFSAATAAASSVQEEAAKTEADDDDEEGEELQQADDVDKTEEPGGWHTGITFANVVDKVLKCFYWFYNNYRQSCLDAKWAFELKVIFYILFVYIISKFGNPVN